MFTIARPTVVLPQPDSPTSPSVSPWLSANDTPSTARTSPVLRSSTPPKIGNLTFRSWTSRMGGIVFVGDSVKVAADEMARCAFDQRRLGAGTRFESIGAARRELAAGRQLENVGDRSGDGCEACGFVAVHARQGTEQPFRVR